MSMNFSAKDVAERTSIQLIEGAAGFLDEAAVALMAALRAAIYLFKLLILLKKILSDKILLQNYCSEIHGPCLVGTLEFLTKT